MTITMDIGNADLADLLTRIEDGEDFILTRGTRPVARLSPMAADPETPLDQEKRQKVIDEILEYRKKALPVTQAEIAEWKAIGRR